MEKNSQPSNPDNGWREWSRYVLQELKEHNKVQEAILRDITSIRVELAGLQVKAGVWGVLGGMVPILIGLALWLLKKMA